MKYVYKIIAALLAAAVIPAIIFLPLIYYRVESTALQAIIAFGQYLGNDSLTEYIDGAGNIPDTMADSVSLTDLYDMRSLLDLASDTDTASSAFEALKTPLIVAAIFLVLTAICALATAIVAIACKNNRVPVYTSIVGIGLSLLFKFSFDTIAAPILDGKFTSGFLASLIANFESFELTASYYFIPAAFVCVIIWTFLYNITLPENEKLERKRMLNE